MAGPTSAQFSLTLRVEIDHRPGMLGKVAGAIGEAGGTIGSVDLVSLEGGHTCAATNPDHRSGGPADVIDGADLFVGLSGARVMPPEALGRMKDDATVFAMANPNPEVTPEEAAPYARIIATGRSDYPNQINNVLCFPGIFRGAPESQRA